MHVRMCARVEDALNVGMIEIFKLVWVYVRDDVLMKWCFLNYDFIDQY
jgi:hypothetical protein